MSTEPDGSGRRGTVRLTFAASGALAATVVPVFLTGALSRPMGNELGFGDARAGIAVTTFFVSAGIAAGPMSRVTQRLGARTAMRLGIVVSAIGCLSIGGLASSWWHLLAAMVGVGAVVGLVDTAAAGAFAGAIRRGRQGLAFGIKEASVPLASMVAGASVPLAAGWFGWRAGFIAVTVLFPVAWLAVPGQQGAGTRCDDERAGTVPRAVAAPTRPPGASDGVLARPSTAALRPVRWMALGIAAGAGAANAAATLLVPSATSAGLSAGSAGLLLAVASVVSVLVRIVAGWASDGSAGAPVSWVAAALALGGLGTAVLALSGGPVTIVIGAVVTLGAGWGWTGLAFLAAIRLVPDAPARAAGVVLTGLAIGGAAGPTAFAAVGDRAGIAAAWWLAAAGFLVGAAMTARAGRRGGQPVADAAN